MSKTSDSQQKATQKVQPTVWTQEIQTVSTHKQPVYEKTRQFAQETVWASENQAFSTLNSLDTRQPDSVQSKNLDSN